jgi:hypothetical protein
MANKLFGTTRAKSIANIASDSISYGLVVIEAEHALKGIV